MSTTDTSVADTESTKISSLPGAFTATLTGFARSGAPLIDRSGDPLRTQVAARSCVPLNRNDLGKQVAVIADVAHADSPIVIGVIQTPTSKSPIEVTADGRSVEVRAAEGITLTCGDASITLSRDGRVVVRGKHVVTHAAGVNRIRGGSVQIN